MSQQYYYLSAKQEAVGPHLLGELVKLADSELINNSTLIAEAGGEEWFTLESLLEANGMSASAPAKAPSPPVEVAAPPQQETSPTTESATTQASTASEEDVSKKKFVDLKLWNKVEVLTIVCSLAFAIASTAAPQIGQSAHWGRLSLMAAPALLLVASLIFMVILHLLVFTRCWDCIPVAHRKLGARKALYFWLIPYVLGSIGVGTYWLLLPGLFWLYFSLSKLIASIRSWEGIVDKKLEASLNKKAIIFVALLAAQPVLHLLLGRVLPQNLITGLGVGAYLGSYLMGYSLFKVLVWRINALRGNPIHEASFVDTKLAHFGLLDNESGKASSKFSAIKWGSVLVASIIVALATPSQKASAADTSYPELTRELHVKSRLVAEHWAQVTAAGYEWRGPDPFIEVDHSNKEELEWRLGQLNSFLDFVEKQKANSRR